MASEDFFLETEALATPPWFQIPTVLAKMTVDSAARRARPAALEATVTTVTIPGLGFPGGMFVLGDGTRLFCSGDTILQISPSDSLTTITGDPQDEEGSFNGQGIFARFNCPAGMTVDRVGNVVVVDRLNHTFRSVTKEGAVVRTLTGGRIQDDEEDDGIDAGFTDGPRASALFNQLMGVVVTANDR